MRKKGERGELVDVARRDVRFNLSVGPNLQRLRDATLATFSPTSSGRVDTNGSNVRRILGMERASVSCLSLSPLRI